MNILILFGLFAIIFSIMFFALCSVCVDEFLASLYVKDTDWLLLWKPFICLIGVIVGAGMIYFGVGYIK